MELDWQATLRSIGSLDRAESPAQVQACDIDLAGLIIAIVDSSDHSLTRERCKTGLDRLVFWEIESDAQRQPSIENQIKNLVVRLILEGGKRKSLEPVCPQCHLAVNTCSCHKKAGEDKKPAGVIRVGLETKGRGGKAVTVASGFSLDEEALSKLAKTLKKSCGCGGTVKDNQIEIQGDQREKLISELGKLGYRAKRAGG